jgi:hypothetical protein
MADDVRVELGFDGGLIVSMRLDSGEWDRLRTQLDQGSGSVTVTYEEGTCYIDVTKVSYTKCEQHVGKVGF